MSEVLSTKLVEVEILNAFLLIQQARRVPLHTDFWRT